MGDRIGWPCGPFALFFPPAVLLSFLAGVIIAARPPDRTEGSGSCQSASWSSEMLSLYQAVQICWRFKVYLPALN